MTTLKEENNRFREAYNGMSQYEKNKIAGEDNPRTRQEELALMEETAQISKNIETRHGLRRMHNAIIFAAKAHEGQVRKGTSMPYIVHPMEVMKILTDNKCDETVIIAGLLHDTLEDTSTKPEDIAKNFGQEVLDLVKSESEDKTKSWQERKQTTIDNLADASTEVQLICCADKLSNIISIYTDKMAIGDKVFDRFNATKDQIKWYYQKIAKALTKIDDYKMKKDLINFINIVF